MKPILSILLFLLAFFPFAGKAQENAADRQALIEIYNNLGGSGWTTPWDLSQPMSTWAGVTLTNGRVTKLNLDSRNLQETFLL